MFPDVADFVQEAETPSQVRHLVDRAIRIALGNRSVGVLVLPGDLQEMAYENPSRKHGNVLSSIGYTRPRVVPYEADLRRAAA
jgi:pyruvate dehydrogenase (quinone)